MVLAFTRPQNLVEYMVLVLPQPENLVKYMVLVLTRLPSHVKYMVSAFTRPQNIKRIKYMVLVLSQPENSANPASRTTTFPIQFPKPVFQSPITANPDSAASLCSL